jgi:signal peptidase II
MASGADRRLYWTAGITVLVLDIITKYWAERELVRHSGRSVFGEWFQLRLVYNPGAAFGLDLGPYSRWIFMGVALVAVVALFRMSAHAEPGDWFRQLALGLVSGGALGNLIDRVRAGEVTDYVEIGSWPPFNVADAAITVGVLLFAWILLREEEA